MGRKKQVRSLTPEQNFKRYREIAADLRKSSILRDGLLDGVRCVSFVNIEDGKMDAVATSPIEDDALLRDFAIRTRRFLNNDDTNFGRVKNLLQQITGQQSAQVIRGIAAAWDAPLTLHTSTLTLHAPSPRGDNWLTTTTAENAYDWLINGLIAHADGVAGDEFATLDKIRGVRLQVRCDGFIVVQKKARLALTLDALLEQHLGGQPLDVGAASAQADVWMNLSTGAESIVISPMMASRETAELLLNREIGMDEVDRRFMAWLAAAAERRGM